MQQRPLFIISLIAAFNCAYAQVEVSTLAEIVAHGGITVHPVTNDIYVGEFGSLVNTGSTGTVVVRVTPDAQISTFAANLGFSNAGNDFDSQGNLLQAAFSSNRIWRIAPDGTATQFANVAGPVGVVVDADDNIFVTSCSNIPSIIRIPAGTNTPSVFAQNFGFNCPNGLTIDEQGNLYTVNFTNARVFRIAPDATVDFIAVAGDDQVAPGGGHIVYNRGKLYVVGRTEHQIFEITLDGQVSILAGTGVDGNQDGPADQASFSRPNGIGVSNDGRFLYVVGSSSVTQPGPTNNFLRVIDLGPEGGPFDFALAEGAWLNRDTDGEGILFDFGPTLDLLFAAWFTSTLEEVAPADPPDIEVGGRGQRWMTSLLTLDGNTASGPLRARQGGAFDMPPAENEASAEVGDFSVQFLACDLAEVNYTINSTGTTGSFEIEPLEKVVNPNGFSCNAEGVPAND